LSKLDRVAAIIVAAGMGVRMGGEKKKQYHILAHRPVLAHTLLVFDKCDLIEEIFLVISEDDYDLCRHLVIDPLKVFKPLHVTFGGDTRQESVLNGLMATEGRFGVVAIHDGVRPLVRIDKVSECVEIARKYGGCILAEPATNTIKTIDEQGNIVATMKRKMIRMAQTPQVFHYDLILDAHLFAQEQGYAGTDDAELVEIRGKRVRTIPGSRENIKITTPEDLRIAHIFLENMEDAKADLPSKTTADRDPSS